MNIKYVDINTVIPYENNPRINEPAIETVANSIKEYGFKNPIIVDKNMVIIAGHTRRKAAIKLGLKEVPVIIASDLSEEKIKAFRILENKASEYAEWDYELLLAEIDDIKLESDIDDIEYLTGFSEDELDELDNIYNFDTEEPEEEYKEDKDPVEPPSENPYSKLGDIWILGKHRLMCGSSTDIKDIRTLMDGQKADLLLTDPPYNVAYKGTAGSIKNDDMDDNSFYHFLFDFYKGAKSVLKPNSGVYIYYATVESINFKKALKDAGFKLLNNCMWMKDRFTLGRSDYHWHHEPCLYATSEGEPRWYGSDQEPTVWEFDRRHKCGEHPTMKPVPLFQYNIKNSTKEGDLVLDTFGGSGTTLIASEMTGRRSCTMEFDPKFVDVIVKRYLAHKGNGGEDITLIRDGKVIPFSEIDMEEEVQ